MKHTRYDRIKANNQPQILVVPGTYLLREPKSNIIELLFIVHYSTTNVKRKIKKLTFRTDKIAFQTAQQMCNKNGFIYTNDRKVFEDQN